jgi:hypothetical protein
MAQPNQQALLKQLDPNAGGIQPSADLPPAMGAPEPAATAAPPAWMNSTESVNLPGWEGSRTDGDPKYQFGRFAQSKGGTLTGDDIRGFVAADPRWEIQDGSSQDDPRIRVKQGDLNTWKPGHESRWQDVIQDSGPGGANRAQFINSEPDPGGGLPPLPGPMLPSAPGAELDPMLSDDPLQKILAAIGQHGGNADALLGKLGG